MKKKKKSNRDVRCYNDWTEWICRLKEVLCDSVSALK